MKDLSEFEAEQFAEMLLAGVPPSFAVKYFFPEDVTQEELSHAARVWQHHEKVSKAFTKKQGKNWMKMSQKERIEAALEKQYNEMAFFLMHNSYADLEDKKLSKADKCREVLEKKVSGESSANDPMLRLMQDILAGRVPQSGNVTVPAKLPIALPILNS